MTFNLLLEELINNIGGCGRYQWILSFLIHFAKTCCCWSMVQMTFNGQEPGYWCESIDNTTVVRHEGVCDPGNYTCDARVFSDNMKTIVNEWDLVCENKWSVAMVTTIQMAGVLMGCFTAGILGDVIGRKPTFFLSLCLVIAFNVVAYFSVSWEMYAAMRFGIGLGVGSCYSVDYTLMTESMPTLWRPRALAIPAWAIASSLFALVVWLIRDWKYVHLASAAVGMPFLLSYCFVQESSRWLITKQRYKEADNSIRYIAKVNGHGVPDVSSLVSRAEAEFKVEDNWKTKVTLWDLVKTCSRAKTTVSLLFIWFSNYYSYYGLLFGIGTLAGNLYLNIFVSNIMEAPIHLSTFVFVNRFGRKASCFGFFFVTAIFGLIVGIVQYVETPFRGVITNVFAYGCKMTLAAGATTMTVYTLELYPTTVRNTAYGLHNTAARVGGMIAPQIVFLNDYVDGLLYFVSAAVMFISALLFCQFPETKGRPLHDTYSDEDKRTSSTSNSEHGYSNDGFIKERVFESWEEEVEIYQNNVNSTEKGETDNTRL